MASADDISNDELRRIHGIPDEPMERSPPRTQKNVPQRFFDDIVELIAWRYKAEGQEMIQTSVNQVFNAHPTALVAMYLDWRQAKALERSADALEDQV